MPHKTLFFVIAGLCWPIFIYADFTFPGCDDLQSSDFQSAQLFRKSIDGDPNAAVDAGLAEPVAFDLAPVWQGDSVIRIDVFFVERLGKVKYYNAATNSVSEAATIDVRGVQDYGLMGVAVHPDYSNNRWIYVWYAPRTNDQGMAYGANDWKRMILSRFTVSSNNQLDMGSEKKLMELRGNKRDDWHAGGPMTFDSQGNLWVTVGNNSTDHDAGNFSHISRTDSVTSDEWGSSNTSSLRGSILRIRPDSSEKGYHIPEGNFGDYWAAQFEQQGNSALADEYRDTSVVKPEIYTKGHRSNFSIAVHPVKNWVAWGEVNYESSRDEFNLAKNPVFAGYPYFHGDQERTAGHQQVFGFLQDPDAPRNTSPLRGNGVEQLPPAVPGTINGLARVAISGPIYSYDSTLASTVKFPPHLNDHWITWDWTNNTMWAHTLNTDGNVTKTEQVSGSSRIFSNLQLLFPIAARFGPEGSFYILNYNGNYSTVNPGLSRLDYQGDCLPYKDPTPVAFNPTPAYLKYSGHRISIQHGGEHLVRVYDIDGSLLRQFTNRGPRQYESSQLFAQSNGLFLVKITVAGKVFSRKYSVLPY